MSSKSQKEIFFSKKGNLKACPQYIIGPISSYSGIYYDFRNINIIINQSCFLMISHYIHRDFLKP